MRQDLELMRESIDLHLHAGPSIFPRLMDANETAKVAKANGMRGIVIKHHHTPTVDRGYFIRGAVSEFEVYGGITLNYAAGGLKPLRSGFDLKDGRKNSMDAIC